MRAASVIKRTALWSALTVGTLVLLLALGAGYLLGTEHGRQWAVSQAQQLAAGQGLELDITGLSSPSLGEWTLQHLRVLRDDQLMVEARDVRLHWSPSALLEPHLLVYELGAKSLSYYQLPSTQQEPEPASDAPFSLPEFIPVTVLALEIKRLELVNLTPADSPALPELAIEGDLAAFHPDYPVRMNLNSWSLPDRQTELKIATTRPSAQQISLEGQLSEEAGGYVGSLLQLPPGQHLDAGFNLSLSPAEQGWQLEIQKLALPFLDYDLAAEGRLLLNTQDTALSVPALSLTVDEHTQQISGFVSGSRLEFDLDLKQLPLGLGQPWLPEPVSGELSGQARGQWVYSETQLPGGEFDLQLNVSAREQTLQGTVAGSLAQDLIQLDKARLQLQDTTLEGQGTVDIFGSSNDIKAELRQFDTALLEPWPVPVPEDLSARAPRATLRLTQSFTKPDITVRTQASARYRQEQFDINADARFDLNKANIKTLRVANRQRLLEASGRVNWQQQTADARVTLKNFTQTLFEDIQHPALPELPAGLTFNANGNASIKGRFQTPKVSSELRVEGTYQHNEQAIPYRVALNADAQVGTPEQLVLDIRQAELDLFDERVVEIKGRVNQQQTDLQILIDRLPTHTLAALGYTNIRGEAEADLRLSGNREAPQLNGFVRYKSEESREQQPDNPGAKAPPLNVTARFLTQEQRLTTELAVEQEKQEVGAFTLSLPLQPYLNADLGDTGSIPLQITADGTLDLGISSWFLNPDAHNLNGSIHSEFTVSGTVREPRVDGTITTDNTQYDNYITNTHFKNIRARIVGRNTQIEIEQIKATDHFGGTMSLSGAIDLAPRMRDNRQMIKATLVAKDASVMEASDLNGKLHGQVQLNGHLEEMWVKGDMTVMPLNMSIERAIRTPIPQIQYTVVEEDTEPTSSVMPTVNLDMTLKTERQAYIRGRGLDTELIGQIRLTGTLEELNYRGKFTTKRGRMELFGKRFLIDSGTVQISNEVISLDIPATYSGKNYDFKIRVHGTQDDLNLELSSSPTLPEDEILAQLLFGKSVNDITPFQALMLANAVQTLRKGSSFDPLGATRHALGVDTITIDNEETEDGNTGLSLGIGKYVNERVYVELKHTPDPGQPWQGNVEIELTPNVTLETSTEDTGGGRAEIIWKKDY